MSEPSKLSKQWQEAGESAAQRDTGRHDTTVPAEPARSPSEQTPASPATGPLAALVGTCFDDFELLELVGRGGMGAVFKARQKSLDRVVAIKLLTERALQGPEAVARLHAEARAVAALGHPNIVRVFQVGHSPFGCYFVMEFIEGRSLASLLQRRPLPAVAAAKLLIPVSEAVHYAHTKGIIHRDLKPENIMVDRFRRPVVMDFGLAKVRHQPSLTREGVIIGTPGYMAPEQADRKWGQVSPRTDVYSLGAVLYNAVTGRPPFLGDTPLHTIVKVVSPEPPPPLRRFRPEVPAELERVCSKCLNKVPADRYETAKELANELRGLVRHWPSAETPAKPQPQRPSTRLAAELVSLETGKVLRISSPCTRIGRSSDCDVVLRASDVSKHHCRLLLAAGRVTVEDLGSSNGTFVNGLPVERSELHDGDRLQIATHPFDVRLRPA